MAKAQSTSIVPQTQSANLPAVPDFMQDDTGSLDALAGYIRPPRVKMVQALSDAQIVREFGIGSVVLLPQGVVVNEMPRDSKGNALPDDGVPFIFTPLFFFAEFCVWNPLELKGTVNAIRDRTFDPNDQIAKMSKNQQTRKQPYPEDPQYSIHYVEHMNFIVAIQGLDEPAVLSFQRAEFVAGQKFAGLLRQRKCPMFGGVYAAYTGHRENNKGNWYGLDIVNPPEGTPPFVSEQDYPAFRALHDELKEQHEQSLIRVDYESETVSGEVSVSGPADTM